MHEFFTDFLGLRLQKIFTVNFLLKERILTINLNELLESWLNKLVINL